MAYCEHRVGQNTAGENFASNVKHGVTHAREDKKPQGAIIAGTNSDLCQVKLNQIDPMPLCELPDVSGQDCPIAQFTRGEIDIRTANAKLKVLFGQA